MKQAIRVIFFSYLSATKQEHLVTFFRLIKYVPLLPGPDQAQTLFELAQLKEGAWEKQEGEAMVSLCCDAAAESSLVWNVGGIIDGCGATEEEEGAFDCASLELSTA